MKGKYLRKLGAVVLAALILPGVVTLLSGSSTQAQGRSGAASCLSAVLSSVGLAKVVVWV
jgi:hypothetical protein